VALFGAARQARRDDKDLGKGIWRRAHDRFRRALERYHQVLEGVQDDGLYGELLPIANQVAGLLPRVRNCCVAAQSMHPTDGLDIPGGPLAEVHRSLSKAGNSLAATAQAAAMARLGGTEGYEVGVENVRRHAAVVLSDLAEAERLLAGLEHGGAEQR
jgi:hypothetical protein